MIVSILVIFLTLKKNVFSLGRYIPKYFILFVAMVNGIVSLISFSALIAVAKTSRTMLNSSGEVDTLVLFLTLGEMLSIFHH